MANMNTAAQYNSEQMAELVAALKGVLANVEAASAELKKPCKFFTAEDQPITGRDAADFIDAFASMEKQADIATETVAGLSKVIGDIADKMEVSMDYANKSAKEAAEALTAVTTKIADAKNAK